MKKWMVSGRLARSRKSGPGGPEGVHERFDKELNREMDGARARKSGPGGSEAANEKNDKELKREMDGFR